MKPTKSLDRDKNKIIQILDCVWQSSPHNKDKNILLVKKEIEQQISLAVKAEKEKTEAYRAVYIDLLRELKEEEKWKVNLSNHYIMKKKQ